MGKQKVDSKKRAVEQGCSAVSVLWTAGGDKLAVPEGSGKLLRVRGGSTLLRAVISGSRLAEET